ncbi:MAG: hypothetical protein MJ166_01965, partial [Clostridia bacterium]|nr:hypothetical protein [Clostridia bacterium]
MGKINTKIKQRFLSLLVSILMVFNGFFPLFTMPVYAATEGTDITSSVTSVAIKNVNTPFGPNSGIEGILNFTVPNFTSDHPYIYYDFNQVKIVDSDGNETTAFDMTTFPKVENEEAQFDGSDIKYTYSIIDGVIIFDMSPAFDSNGNMIDQIPGHAGFANFSCSLNQTALSENQAKYTLKFVHGIDDPTINPQITVTEKPNIDRSLTVSKVGSNVNLANKTIDYTITIKNDGSKDCEPLVISDTLGNGVYAIQGEPTIEPASIGITTQKPEHPEWNQKGYSFTLGNNIPAGSTATIKYTCKLEDAFMSQNQLQNDITSIKMTGDDRPVVFNGNNTSLNSSYPIDYKVVSKSGTYSESTNTVDWKININNGSTKFNLKGMTLKDTLDDTVQMELAEGTSIKVTNKGTGVTETLTDLSALNNYSFGNADNSNEYEITYTTHVTSTFEETDPTAQSKNTAEIYDGSNKVGESSSYVKVHDGPNGGNDNPGGNDQPKINASKKANDVQVIDDKVYAEWLITIEVPTSPSPVSLSVRDQFNGALSMDTSKPIKMYYIDENDNEVEVPWSTNQYDTPSKIVDPSVVPSLAGKTLYVKIYSVSNFDPNNSNISNQAQVTLNENIQSNPQASYNVPVPENYVRKDNGTYDSTTDLIKWTLYVNHNNGNGFTVTSKNWDTITLIDDLANGTLVGDIIINDNSGNNFKVTKVTELPEGGISFDLKDTVLDNGWTPDPLRLTNNLIITYYTKPAPDSYPLSNSGTSTVENNITFIGTVKDDPTTYKSSTKGSCKIEEDILFKTLVEEESVLNKDNPDTLTFKITLNPHGTKLSPDGSTSYKVIDTLPKVLDYVPGSLVITNASTGDQLTKDSYFDESVSANEYEFSLNGQDLELFVPDSTPLIIKYKVRLNTPGNLGSYANTVAIPQPYAQESTSVSTNTNKQIFTAGAGFVDGTILFYIDKISSTETETILGGAKFKAVEYDLDGTKTNKEFEATTVAGEPLSSDLFVCTSDDTYKMTWDHIYEISEIEPPIGYDPNDTVYRIAILNPTKFSDITWNDPTKPIKVLPIKSHLTVVNDSQIKNPVENELTVAKLFSDGTTDLSEVEFEIRQGSVSGAVLATLNSDKGFSQKTLLPGTYVIVETKYPSKYTPADNITVVVDDEGKITMSGTVANVTCVGGDSTNVTLNVTNVAKGATPTPVHSVQITKTFSDGATDASGVEFEVHENTATGEVKATLNSGNEFKNETLAVGKYVIVESSCPAGYTPAANIEFEVNSDYTISYTGSLAATGKGTTALVIPVENKAIDNSVQITKTFSDGTTDVSAVEFEIHEGSATGTVKATLKSENNFKSGTLAAGKYVIVESKSPAGYTPAANIEIEVNADKTISYTGSLVATGKGTTALGLTVENQAIDNSVKITKTFSDGSTDVSGVVFQIRKDNAEGTVVDTLKSSNSFTSKTLATGKYVIVESSYPAGYT